jgi:hypothetical protein
MRAALVLFAGCAAIWMGATAVAQQPPSETAKGMVGTWELSNADRDRNCTVTFKLDPAASGYALALANRCATVFPAIRDIVAWSMGKRDMLLLNDAKGQPVLEMLEVEAGTYEGLRPNEGRYVLQNAAVAAATRDRTADQMFGEWAFVRGTGGGNPICFVTLANVAADADSFAVTVKAGCDQLVTRFAPVSWLMDRGQLVMRSGKGEAWRFEESETTAWRRVPETRQPMLLVRQ